MQYLHIVFSEVFIGLTVDKFILSAAHLSKQSVCKMIDYDYSAFWNCLSLMESSLNGTLNHCMWKVLEYLQNVKTQFH